MWAAAGVDGRLQRPQGADRPRREQDPADGRRRRLRLRRPDAQLRHPRHRLERAPRRRRCSWPILLGPEAAFLVMASVLAVQALFFADGGLLALGCNIFNLGFFPASSPTRWSTAGSSARDAGLRAGGSSPAASWPPIVGLQLGALGVVLETTRLRRHRAALRDLRAAHAADPPGHRRRRGPRRRPSWCSSSTGRSPRLLARSAARQPLRGLRLRPVVVGLAVAALVAGAGLSWFASTPPDGLEWSIAGARRAVARRRGLIGESAAPTGALLVIAATVLAGVVLHRRAARRRAARMADGGGARQRRRAWSARRSG